MFFNNKSEPQQTYLVSELLNALADTPSNDWRGIKCAYPEQNPARGHDMIRARLSHIQTFVLDSPDAWSEFDGTGIVIKTAWEGTPGIEPQMLMAELEEAFNEYGDLNVFVDLSPYFWDDARYRCIIDVGYDENGSATISVGEAE